VKIDEDTIQSINIAENLDEETLTDLGEKLVTLVKEDDQSREEWLKNQATWIKLTSQVIEQKNTPWDHAANVKYPLLTTACLNFHARAYGALFNEPNLVNVRVYGEDPEGIKQFRAYRTAAYANFYLIEKMPDWLDGMDRGLFILAISGMMYKKTYYSTVRNRVASDLITAKDVILNYNARNFETARKTHRMWLTENQIEEYKRKGVFLDVDLAPAAQKHQDPVQDKILGMHPTGGLNQEEDALREIYEIHWSWDLDKDGYREPWIFTVDRDTNTVLRIVPRFEWKDVETSENGKKIVCITPEEQFTRYIFIPDPNSPLYGMGLGSLVGPLNLAINTNINQLIDSGTLSIMSTGFLGKGLNLRGGKIKVKPGLWQTVNNLGDDLRKEIIPIPANQPSPTLFQLLELLIQSGERLASINDAMMGENPGQNQPYATTAAVLEQGLKVFVGIYKRIFKSLGDEYEKIFNLFYRYMDAKEYGVVLDQPQVPLEVLKEDFNPEDCDIRPVGDPRVVTDAQKMMRSQLLIQKWQILPNKEEALKRVLEAEGHSEVQKLMTSPKPPEPSIEEKQLQLDVAKFEHQRQLDMASMQMEGVRTQSGAEKDHASAVLNTTKAAAIPEELKTDRLKMAVDAHKTVADIHMQDKEHELKREEMGHEASLAGQQHSHEKEVAKIGAQSKSNSKPNSSGSK